MMNSSENNEAFLPYPRTSHNVYLVCVALCVTEQEAE